MSPLKWFLAGTIVTCISVLGTLVVLTIIGSLVIPFVQWLESNPIWRGVFTLASLVLIVALFLAFSKWVLSKVV